MITSRGGRAHLERIQIALRLRSVGLAMLGGEGEDAEEQATQDTTTTYVKISRAMR